MRVGITNISLVSTVAKGKTPSAGRSELRGALPVDAGPPPHANAGGGMGNGPGGQGNSRGRGNTRGRGQGQSGAAAASDLLAIFHVQNQQTAGTQGGTSSTDTVHTRVLNTSVYNAITGASLGSNQITLPAGTYDVEAMAAHQDTGKARLSLYNVSDSAVELLGLSDYCIGGTTGTLVHVAGQITLAEEKVFELRHYIQTGDATWGLGRAEAAGRTEVYSDVMIRAV